MQLMSYEFTSNFQITATNHFEFAVQFLVNSILRIKLYGIIACGIKASLMPFKARLLILLCPHGSKDCQPPCFDRNGNLLASTRAGATLLVTIARDLYLYVPCSRLGSFSGLCLSFQRQDSCSSLNIGTFSLVECLQSLFLYLNSLILLMRFQVILYSHCKTKFIIKQDPHIS